MTTAPGLLVSVRSATEALAAATGGARVIDLKEPARGPLGATDPAVWLPVRAALGPEVPLSAALGEVGEWDTPPDSAWHEALAGARLQFRKLGLSGLGPRPDWVDRWRAARERLGAGTGWIAVIYSDWERAQAPAPDAVVAAALAAPDVVGVLVDTWSKAEPAPSLAGDAWRGRWDRIRASGRRVVLAGRLDADRIRGHRGFLPDLFAVRGAACRDGDRLGPIDADRVANLVAAVRAAGDF